MEELVRSLASDDPNVVQDAGVALEGRLEAVERVLTAIPSLAPFGQLCAIDVIGSWPLDAAHAVRNPSVTDVLVPLLHGENASVREWAVNVLGWIGAVEAVPEIRDALERSKAAGVPPDWTEPDRYRWALTVLGGRVETIPPRVEALALSVHGGRRWRVGDVREVVEALAAAGQVAHSLQGWHEGSWVEGPAYDIDLSGDWPEVVARNRDAALHAIDSWSPPEATLVSLDWISEADR